MREILPAILALLMAIAGWHYLFYSRAAHRLSSIEAPPANRRRVRLRRLNGLAMLALAACFYAGFRTVDWEQPTSAFIAVWLSVFLLLVLVLVLVAMDLRLTWKMRQERPRRNQP